MFHFLVMLVFVPIKSLHSSYWTPEHHEYVTVEHVHGSITELRNCPLPVSCHRCGLVVTDDGVVMDVVVVDVDVGPSSLSLHGCQVSRARSIANASIVLCRHDRRRIAAGVVAVAVAVRTVLVWA